MYACACINAHAEHLSFNPTIKFRIVATSVPGSSAAPGMPHGVNTPVVMTTDDANTADCYWYIQEYKEGQYALRNVSTNEYMTWDEVRSDNPIRRYLNLTATMNGEYSLWSIRDLGSNVYTFENIGNSGYRFNVRSGSNALGTYASSGNSVASNERFYIMKDDGNYYDQKTDYNNLCGKDADGLYWTTYPLEQPFVLTTKESDPVYYYIKSVRSRQFISPTEWLSQSVDLPQKRFYFVKSGNGVQIRVEGGSYVSAVIPENTSDTGNDVSVVEGKPADNDELWAINYFYGASDPGYSIGVLKCNANSEDNKRVILGRTYWNDYEQKGICWWSVDNGSVFMFYSKDERHRDYLASQGLVITGSNVPDDSDDPSKKPNNGNLNLEDIEGNILHVYRADGKVDAVPRMYIDQVQHNNDAIRITTINGGPSYNYMAYEVDSLSEVAPEMPMFNSFKFNNKFNHHIIEDAEGVFEDDTLITATVVGIGKTLRPSYKLDDDVQAWVGDSVHRSKQTRVRFDKGVVYTVARRGYTILRRTTDEEYITMPYGREVTVMVDFATDHSNGEYQVPTIYITTDNGTSINSKSYYWDGKVTIDGAGIFPDLPETPMQIKGRGNSSWTATGKAPYHMKFATATKVLGLKKGKHWNLIANAQTRSMTTNALSMKMAQMVETAGFNHEIPVELYINGEYRGSYNLTEKVGFSNNSVDLEDETYATLLELDTYYDEEKKFRTTAYYLPVNIKEPDLTDGSSPLTLTEIANSFNPVWKALESGEGFGDLLDLDYLARFLLVDELSENYEFFWPKSTFCFNENIRDPNSKYIFGPCWDFDWGYGYQLNGNYFTGSPTNDFWNRVTHSAALWGRALRYNGKEFDKIYYRLWHEFINNGSLDELIDFCDDYYSFAAPSFTHNNSKWGGGDANSYATVTTLAKDWLRKRAEYIYNYMGKSLGYNNLGYLDDLDNDILLGDVNNDGQVTTADVVCVFNYILGLPNEDFEFEQADLDRNDIITIADLISVRNLALAQPAKSGLYYGLPEAEAIINLGTVCHNAEGISIPLVLNVGNGDYSGMQFDIRIPAGMTLDNIDISRAIPNFDVEIAELDIDNTVLSKNEDVQTYRVSVYSSAHNKLPIGRSELTLDLSWGDAKAKVADINSTVLRATLANVLFASSLGEDERGQSRSVEFVVDEPTGINGAVSIVDQQGNNLTLNSAGEAVVPVYGVDGRVFRYYKLQGGNETISLPHGVYIINKQKIIIR